jgi:peptide/nickel transport system permease protein
VLGTMVVSPMAARWALALAGVAAITKAIDRVGKRRTGGRFDVSIVFAEAWLLTLVFAAVFAGVLPLEDPHALPLDSETLARPDLFSAHPLGTDIFGRDYVSRLVYGARVSLAVGIGTVAIGLAFGSLLGVCAGYLRGKVEAVVNALTDFMLAFPPLVFLLALVAILRPGLGAVFVGLSVLTVPTFVRLAKANTIRVSGREYVLAARAMGATHRRAMVREVLPNVLPPLVTYSIVIVPSLIVAEAALSFLNLSVRLPYPTWGNMIAEAQTIFADNPHTVLLPGSAMFLTVFSLNRLSQVVRSRWERSA